MEFRIDVFDRAVLDGKVIGDFKSLQKEIQDSRMDLVQKYKIKAVYAGNAQFRYIADWEMIIREYYAV